MVVTYEGKVVKTFANAGIKDGSLVAVRQDGKVLLHRLVEKETEFSGYPVESCFATMYAVQGANPVDIKVDGIKRTIYMTQDQFTKLIDYCKHLAVESLNGAIWYYESDGNGSYAKEPVLGTVET